MDLHKYLTTSFTLKTTNTKNFSKVEQNPASKNNIKQTQIAAKCV